jgi:hypothetical protein
MARWIEAARWIAFPGRRVPPVEAIWLRCVPRVSTVAMAAPSPDHALADAERNHCDVDTKDEVAGVRVRRPDSSPDTTLPE